MLHKNRALLVLTSHDDLGGTDATGYTVQEAADPWRVLSEAGYEVDIASVAGGEPPRDGYDRKDPTQQAFLADPKISKQLSNTKRIGEIEPEDYRIVYFVGGHGTLWDFPDSEEISTAARAVHASGGVIAAVCHGPAALLGVTLEGGRPLIEGRRVTGFSNDEESAVGLAETVPFSLADELASRGAKFVAGPEFEEHVITDGRLVTGQNPQSAAAVARAAIELVAA